MEVRLPRLGEGADSGTVASIFVKVGDRVNKDQPILELESEKAVASIPSPAAGTIMAMHVKDGDLIKVGQLIFTLNEGAAPAPVNRRWNPQRPGPAGDRRPLPGIRETPAQRSLLRRPRRNHPTEAQRPSLLPR